MTPKLISIIIPIIRPKRVEKCINAIRAGSGGVDYELITMVDDKRIGAPAMVKRLVEVTNFDLVMFLGDDTVPEPGFLTESLAIMQTFQDGWGLVGLNDQIHDGANPLAPATHWLAHKKLLPFLGGEFFNTNYYHCYCDNELTDRCREIDRYKFAPAAVINHEHFIFGTAAIDADYARVYSRDYLTRDFILFEQRKAGGWK